jgi:hypothetical protein
VNAVELIEALRRQYQPAHGWIVLPQVRDATGWQGKRTADAIALNAWPSRGLELHGFELKTYRGDWLRELKQPAKAESIFRYCDRWWIVTPAPHADDKKREFAIVQEGELPPTWGHIMFAADDVTIAKEAPKLKAAPLDRVFLAAVLRALAGAETPEAKLAAARAEGLKEGRECGLQSALRRMAPTELEAVRWRRESLTSLEDSAKRILADIRRELAEVRKIPDLPRATDEEDDGQPAAVNE